MAKAMAKGDVIGGTVGHISIKQGDVVRLKGSKSKETAKVSRVMLGFDGVIILDRPIRGFTYYAPQELVKVKNSA